jgi:enamine deaminase RidA (YjgF/YER057c/UK114 family)
MMERLGSGGPWERTYGYSRTVSAGGWVHCSGCTSTVDGTVAHAGDAGAQAETAFRIGLSALEAAGARIEQVVRTRMYVVRASDADTVGRVHGRVFATVRPAATLVIVAGLLHPDHLVEVELEAYTG